MLKPSLSKRYSVVASVGSAALLCGCARAPQHHGPTPARPNVTESRLPCSCATAETPSKPQAKAAPPVLPNSGRTDDTNASGEPPSAITPTPTPVSPVERIKVTHFDCFSAIDGRQSQSLRQWASGGPHGAAWNIYGFALNCEMTVESPCAGRSETLLLGNTRQLAKSATELTRGKNTVRINIAASTWEKATIAHRLGYETLLLSIGGIAVCDDVDSSTYPFADAFLAGFSGGE